MPDFKAKVALDALKGNKTLADLAGKYDIRQNRIRDRKKQLPEQADTVLDNNQNQKPANKSQPKDRHTRTGEPALKK